MGGALEIVLQAKAWAQAQSAAGRDAPYETGGILLGWRVEGGVFVPAIVEVPDRHAGHSFYRRRHNAAEAVMQDVLATFPPESAVGYVGEWHVHPKPCGPSWLDRRELRRISKKAAGTVALVVCAPDANGTWMPHGACATRGRSQAAAVHIIQEDNA